jgi:tetratricopeptide (TPR) repeat protein
MAGRRRVRSALAGVAVLLIWAGPVWAQRPLGELDRAITDLSRQGREADAIPLAREALGRASELFGAESPQAAYFTYRLGVLHKNNGEYAEAERWIKQSYALSSRALGNEHPDALASYVVLGDVYVRQARYAEAETVLRASLAGLVKAFPQGDRSITSTRISLGQLYLVWQKYDLAEGHYLAALPNIEREKGADSLDAAVVHNDLSVLYKNRHELTKGEEHARRSLAIYRASPGQHQDSIATALDNLGSLRQQAGDYIEAERCFRQGLALREATLRPDHPQMAESLNNLAVLYQRIGRFAEAGPLLTRALDIRRSASGEIDPDVAAILGNLADIASGEGRLAEAAELFGRVVRVTEATLGPESPALALALGNLGVVEYERVHDARAEELLRLAVSVSEKAHGRDDPETAHSRVALAAVLREVGKEAEAQTLLTTSLTLLEVRLGKKHPELSPTLNALGLIYWKLGDYANAEAAYQRTLDVNTAAFGDAHPFVGIDQANLADVYQATGRTELAAQFYRRNLKNLASQFEERFSYMSEADRLTFAGTASQTFGAFLSFVWTAASTSTDLAADAYDLVLWHKSLVATSVTALRAAVAATGDTASVKLLDALSARKRELAGLLTAQDATARARQQVLARAIEDDERALARASSVAAEQQRLNGANWTHVRDALQANEAAVEFVRFPLRKGREWTSETCYVALVVTPTSARPELIVLGLESAIAGAPMNDYRRRARLERDPTVPVVPGFCDTFWRPLLPALKGASRVYVAPDGVLSQVSWSVAPLQGEASLSELDVRIVTSTRELLAAPKTHQRLTAVLVGAPAFSASVAGQRAALEAIAAGRRAPRPIAPAASGGSPPLPPLPETEAEVTAIAGLLAARAWQPVSFTNHDALEGVVKNVEGPRLLHLATHGFFEPAATARRALLSDAPAARYRDVMLQSGLYFAGAERARAGIPPVGDLDDGVLTAYEAAELNLHGTELLVLSACDTGRGQVAVGEGVLGLQRALRQAGAESILMSMWRVPEETTKQLMVAFYTRWLAGMDKHQALREAQRQMADDLKRRFGRDLPDAWGAFMLVGR